MPANLPQIMRAMLLTALAAAAITACENKTDSAPNKLPGGDATTAVDTSSGDVASLPGDASASGGGCDCLAKGQWFRFNTLQIKSLDGKQHLVIGALNPIWQSDIDKHELNFFLEVQDVTEKTLVFRIVNAARTDKAGSMCLMGATSSVITMERNGCALQNKEAAGLNVYAGTVANPKNCTTGLAVPHSIPVRKAFFKADIAPDCSAVLNGLLMEGSIAKDALDSTCTCLKTGGAPAEECGVPDKAFAGYNSDKNEKGKPPVFCTECCKGCNSNFTNLNELLDSFGPLDYTCQDDKGGKAVCLSATFAAKKADMPANCP